MTPGTRPARRAARAAPFPARSRNSALIDAMSAITVALLVGGPAPDAPASPRPASASRGAARRVPARLGPVSPFLVEEARDRALLADALDRLGHQGGDRQLADVARDAHRLGGEDAVCRHQ